VVDHLKIQKSKAASFLALHHAPEILILPNAWDVSSLKIFELEGFKAIATTSAGIAATLGYSDGEKMSLRENLVVCRRIVENTVLPVTVDIEAGYGDSISKIVNAAQSVLDIGAVGLNIEDGTRAPEEPLFDRQVQVAKIREIRKTAVTNDVHLVINARTDAFLVGDPRAFALKNAIDRGNAYKAAGADCVFIPDVGDLGKNEIRLLVTEINAPINIIAGPGTPPVKELQDLGVSRLSLGPRPMRAVLSCLKEMAKELRECGTYDLLADSSISYSDVNHWFSPED